MTSNEDLEALREHILMAFPKKDPPKCEALSPALNYSDVEDFAKILDGKKWWELSREIVYDKYDMLSVLAPVAYHYYLPAYLIYSLDKFDSYNYLLELILYGMVPESGHEAWSNSRKALFSQGQKTVILTFLDLILKDDGMADYGEEAKAAIKFWRD